MCQNIATAEAGFDLNSLKLPLILSLDIGSSSVRSCLFDAGLRMLPRSLVKIAHSSTTANDGSVEFDATGLIGRVESAIDMALSRANRPVDAVALCSFWHSLVGVDDRGRPITPVLTWADTRSREYSAVLKERFDERSIHQKTCAHFHSSFWPAKLLWLCNERPKIWEKTTRWLSFSDLVAERLFGESVTSISMASATGIFEQRKLNWDGELLRYLKVKRAILPRVANDGETFQLTRKYIRRWPLLADSKWLPAIGDGAADHLGSCGSSPNTASLMVGTSAAMRVVLDKMPRRIPAGLWCYRIDSKRVIVGGALSDGGNLYALIKKNFGLKGDVEAEISKRETPEGLVVIPFFHGERSTGYDENARGAIIGMTAEHDGFDVLRAAMEGVAFRLADIYERLSTVTDIQTIVASGGAIRQSPTWTQIIADTLGQNLTVSDADESSLRGAALLASSTTGKM